MTAGHSGTRQVGSTFFPDIFLEEFNFYEFGIH